MINSLPAQYQESADFIVSGDRDLLDIGKYKSVKIISPSEFLKMF